MISQILKNETVYQWPYKFPLWEKDSLSLYKVKAESLLLKWDLDEWDQEHYDDLTKDFYCVAEYQDEAVGEFHFHKKFSCLDCWKISAVNLGSINDI